MRKCTCGSYVINIDEKRIFCDVCFWRLRAEALRAETLRSRLADIAELRRYSLVYDEMQQYDDGVWLKLDDVCQALKEQSSHE